MRKSYKVRYTITISTIHKKSFSLGLSRKRTIALTYITVTCIGVSIFSIVSALSTGANSGYSANTQSSDNNPNSIDKEARPESVSIQSDQVITPITPAVPGKPAAQSAAAAAPQTTQLPATVLDLSNWKLELPVDTPHAGTPDEIKQPELSTFSLSPYFQTILSGKGVLFQANAGGATTANSKYPRSELREMKAGGSQKASWSNNSGTHTMTIRQAITHLPAVKPHVVAGQVHDASDDIVMIRLERNKLFVESDGNSIGMLDANYVLGTVFTVKIEAANGRILVSYNGQQKVDFAKSGSGYYFKAGVYTQSNVSKGDSPSAYGEVIIYDLQVLHS